MLFSLMNEGKDYYVSLHSEWLLHFMDVGEEKRLRNPDNPQFDAIPGEADLLYGKVQQEVLKEMLEERIFEGKIFLDFAYIREFEEAAEDVLEMVLEQWCESKNEVYLTEVEESCRNNIRRVLDKTNILHFEQKSESGKTYYGLGLKGQAQRLSVIECKRMMEWICRENLLILMEEGSQGKFFNIDRLVADGELCLQYFFCRLAMKLIEAGVISGKVVQNKKVCMVPMNEYAISLAKGIAFLTGVTVCGKEELRNRQEMEKVIPIRDVIHMSYEVNQSALLTAAKGTIVTEPICLVDIYTGIGRRKGYISIHIIDLEKRIGKKPF